MKKITIISLLVLATASCKKTTSVLPSPSPKDLILGNWTSKNTEIKQFKGEALIKDTVMSLEPASSLAFESNDTVTITLNLGIPTINNYGFIDNKILLVDYTPFYIITLNNKQLSYLISAKVSKDTVTQTIVTYEKN